MYRKILSVIALTPFLLNAQMTGKMKDETCVSPFHTMHVAVKHTEANGVGYKDGYTTLEAFGIWDRYPSFMPFLDLRGHVFNNGKLAANVGIGERTVLTSINHIFGFNVYYDTRASTSGLKVNQVGPGLELLGKRMEYRINTYFPFGKHKSRILHPQFDRFKGHQIVLKSKRKYAMRGVDAEVGAHLTQRTDHDFFIGAGPYYFTGGGADWGGKGRVYWRYKEYVSLEASYSYDHVFKNIVQGTVVFSYPFGPKLKRKGAHCPNPNDLALSRAAFAPYRFEIPVIRTKKRKTVATNPATGQPWQVWFVKNTSSSDGTFESPFPTLVQAQNASSPNDMIYVFPGDGTSNGMAAGITLKNNQKLFGSGTAQSIGTQLGNITIPSLTHSSPLITNTGTVITLANNNEVSGLNISALSGVGVQGLNINNVSIHNNAIFGDNSGNGIILQGDLAGTFEMFNNHLTNVHDGITFLSFTPERVAHCNVMQNTFSNFNDYAMDLALTEGAVCKVENNDIVTHPTGTASAVIIIEVEGTHVGEECVIVNNNRINATYNPADAVVLIESIAHSTTKAIVTNNTILLPASSSIPGISVYTGTPVTTVCLNLENNTVVGSTVGYQFYFPASTGIVNVDSFVGNMGSLAPTSGNVNSVSSGTCNCGGN